MRRSIDDQPFDPALAPPDWEELDLSPVSWAVAISDDYEDGVPRVVLTVEEGDRPGAGLVLHLHADSARRFRRALRDALVEVGEAPGD